MSAISSYKPELDEEQGGFIVERRGEYKFVPVKNSLSGLPAAHGLYVADNNQFLARVGLPCLDDGWIEFASFHTHPIGCAVYPSKTDLDNLFKNFPINYIYGHAGLLNQFTFDTEQAQPIQCTKILSAICMKNDATVKQVREYFMSQYGLKD